VADRRLMARVPIWVRAPGLIALVLAGVLISTMLLGASGDDSGHGSGDEMQMRDDTGGQGGHGSGDGGHGTGDADRGSGGEHGSGDDTEMRDHNGGQSAPLAPSDSTPRDRGQPRRTSGDRETASSARRPIDTSARTARRCRRRGAGKHHGGTRASRRRRGAQGHHS
jgi:hypothetical protein